MSLPNPKNAAPTTRRAIRGGGTAEFSFVSSGGQHCTRRFWGANPNDRRAAAEAWALKNDWQLSPENVGAKRTTDDQGKE